MDLVSEINVYIYYMFIIYNMTLHCITEKLIIYTERIVLSKIHFHDTLSSSYFTYVRGVSYSDTCMFWLTILHTFFL